MMTALRKWIRTVLAAFGSSARHNGDPYQNERDR